MILVYELCTMGRTGSGAGRGLIVRSVTSLVRVVIAVLVALGVAGCDPDGVGGTADTLLLTDRCEISGAGVLAGEAFSGAARGSDTGARGSWTHEGADGVVLGEAEWILCRINGAMLGDFGGPATIDGRAGYTFRVGVQDFEEASETTETQTVRASRTYRPSRWEDGELTIDEQALVTIPSSLPVVEGNAGNQWAWLTFERADTADVVTCRYRGGASRPNPILPVDVAAGLSYELQRCTGEEPGSPEVSAGDRVAVRWMRLHVHSGAHFHPHPWCPVTTVSVDLQVTTGPVTRDRYRIGVWDDATGERVFFRDGELTSGDLLVQTLP